MSLGFLPWEDNDEVSHPGDLGWQRKARFGAAHAGFDMLTQARADGHQAAGSLSQLSSLQTWIWDSNAFQQSFNPREWVGSQSECRSRTVGLIFWQIPRAKGLPKTSPRSILKSGGETVGLSTSKTEEKEFPVEVSVPGATSRCEENTENW